MTFASLGLFGPLVRAVIDLGYGAPTDVQAAAIPAVLAGGDVWSSAETGSGKTAAFALPLLQRLATTSPSTQGAVRALILVPTRELAVQVAETLVACGRHLSTQPRTCVIIGGGSIDQQGRDLANGCDIVVATPGRLIDQVARRAVDLGQTETLIIDEADKLLSLGFSRELHIVLGHLPAKRQTLLFSATFPPKVQALGEAILHEPTRINLHAGAIATGVVAQRAITVDAERRTMLLRHLLQTEGWPQVLVFVATRHSAEHVASKLRAAGITAAPLHGKLSSTERAEGLLGFKEKRVKVLVATDLAARGIDISGLAAVVNYDLPRSPSDYVHRVGRTGRAGEDGIAVSFITCDNEPHWRLIEKRYELPVSREQLAGFEPVNLSQVQQIQPLDAAGGVKGKRKSKKDKLREAAARSAATPEDGD